MNVSTEIAFRLGSAALGMLTGLLFGFVLAIVSFAALRVDTSFPRCVFGSAGIGLLLGLAHPAAVRRVTEGAVHFLFGVAGAAGGHVIEPNHEAPLWLKALLWLGFAAGIAFYFVL